VKILCEGSADGKEWVETGLVGPDDMLGSFTDLTSGRDVYVFGWHDGMPGLWRAVGGTDEEFGELRKISTFDLELVTPLINPHEMIIVHPSVGMIRVRLSRVETHE
jgi:hypothetical protein